MYQLTENREAIFQYEQDDKNIGAPLVEILGDTVKAYRQKIEKNLRPIERRNGNQIKDAEDKIDNKDLNKKKNEKIWRREDGEKNFEKQSRDDKQ